jgi:hypothetical protein
MLGINMRTILIISLIIQLSYTEEVHIATHQPVLYGAPDPSKIDAPKEVKNANYIKIPSIYEGMTISHIKSIDEKATKWLRDHKFPHDAEFSIEYCGHRKLSKSFQIIGHIKVNLIKEYFDKKYSTIGYDTFILFICSDDVLRSVEESNNAK